MKAGVGFVPSSFSSSPPKRRWRCLVIAVLGLVFLSMLVPLVFLLGLHNGFHNGFGAERWNSVSNHLRVPVNHRAADTRNQSEVNLSKSMDVNPRRSSPTFPQSLGNILGKEVTNDTNGFPSPASLSKHRQKSTGLQGQHVVNQNTTLAHESEVLCEIIFGTYCLWRREQREKMEDSVVKKMKDLLFVARAYYPSIAKLPKFDKLSHEMKQNIQEFERILSETSTDKDLPPNYNQKMVTMDATISKAKSCPVDCNNVDKKFRQLVDLTEDEANFHMKQSAFLYKLAVHTMPKSLHCLSMRLTFEHFSSSLDTDQGVVEKFGNPHLHHFIILSRNILASSVVINSTVLHARESGKLVFHILTDRENYFAMKYWFFKNSYGDASVQVLNIDETKLYNHNVAPVHHLSLPEEYRISFHEIDKLSSVRVRTRYVSIFSQTHYLLPEIFRSLEKVVVLDDDVLVQRDLSDLWNLDMDGKVIAAVQFCDVKLFHLKTNLPSSSIGAKDSCIWTSGLNIINLSSWRARNISKTYQRLVHEMRRRGKISEMSKLSAGMATFEGQVYPLDERWMLSGLGYNYGLNSEALTSAAVLHYDGSMKPWLELGISRYKSYWRKLLNSESQFLKDCNVNQ